MITSHGYSMHVCEQNPSRNRNIALLLAVLDDLFTGNTNAATLTITQSS